VIAKGFKKKGSSLIGFIVERETRERGDFNRILLDDLERLTVL